jgi:hypothetical protein
MNWSLYQCVVTALVCVLVFKLVEMKLRSARTWKVRGITAAIVVVFFMSGISFDRGWPSRSELPDEFFFIHAVVQEPEGDKAGSIVMLIRTKENPDIPYSVIVPYDKQVGEALKIVSRKVLTDGEVPVTYHEGTGFRFHVQNDEVEADNAKSKVFFNKPVLRSI